MKAWLWKLSMRYIVWAYTHLLPMRTHEYAKAEGNPRGYGFNVCPEEDRWTLHTLAAAPPDHPTADYTFWVRDVTGRKEVTSVHMFVATEVESGVSAAPAMSAEAALDNYWKGDFHA